MPRKPMIQLRFDERLISKDNFRMYNKQGRYFLSPEFRAFENRIKWEVKSQYKGKVLTDDLMVFICAYFKNRKHCDIGNLPKSLLDSLQGIIMQNDNQIKELIVKVIENSKTEFIEVCIKTLEGKEF